MKIKTRFLFCILFTITFAYTGVAMSSFIPKEPTESMKFEPGKKYIATIKTTKGEIVCELSQDKAPLSVTNFIQLANGGYYKDLTFHRVVPNFVIQGGDPTGTGSGGPGYTVKSEAENGLKHIAGALAWARLGDSINPDRRSSGSQFYITLAATPHLDGQYTVFGHTLKGMEVVQSIAVGDKILDVVISTQ